MKWLLAITLWTPLAFAQGQDSQRALREIEQFTALQMRTDPHYGTVETVLLKELDPVLASKPATEWATWLRRRYVSLSEAEHAKERDAIRASETDAAQNLGSGEHGWKARLGQLDDEVKAAKLGPRLHALHALEAARIYFPGDEFFIAWRAAKVPIATSYELGTISRSEYEERWSKTTAAFMDRQAADDRARRQLEAQAAAEELRMQVQTLQPPAVHRPMRCTTSTVGGVATTRCF